MFKHLASPLSCPDSLERNRRERQDYFLLNGLLKTMSLCLTLEELRELTGRKRSDAQARELVHLGIPFLKRSDGTLIVFRAHVEGAKTPEPESSLVSL